MEVVLSQVALTAKLEVTVQLDWGDVDMRIGG